MNDLPLLYLSFCAIYTASRIMKLFLLLSVFFWSCNLDIKTGIPNYSNSIEQSKKNGVFVQILKVNKTIIKIGDGRTDTIKQIWIEDAWTYERKYFSIVVKKDSFPNILMRLGHLSDQCINEFDYKNEILLKYNNQYFGWEGSRESGVFNSEYFDNKDTIFVVNKVGNKDTILDTLIITK